MRIAIVHDWLYTYAGAERVLEQLLHVWPQADLFSLFDFLPEAKRGFLQGKQPKTTFIQGLPWASTSHRTYLPLFPLAIEQLDLRNYDIVLSVHYAAAKGVLVGPDQFHVCYCCSPMRYAWDLQHQYLKESGLLSGAKAWIARALLHYLRIWDARSSDGVDEFVSLTDFVSRRIEKTYRRTSTVIPPPVDISAFSPGAERGDFYVTASRMVPYKKMDLIVEAFSRMPSRRLVVIGEGPEFAKIRGLAGPNVELLGYQPFEVLRDHLRRAKAFVFAAEEDFGIAPLEAQACGTPVLAFGKGGALETIRPLGSADPTGHFFHEQTVPSLVRCVEEFEAASGRIRGDACRRNAESYSAEVFRKRMEVFVLEKYRQFRMPRSSRTQPFGD